MAEQHGSYYVPEQSAWPILAALGLFLLGLGTIHLFDGSLSGKVLFGSGAAVILITVFGWFGSVVKESRAGLYDAQMDRTFRWGMLWLLFSDFMLFHAFLGALIYIRFFSVPWLGGSGSFLLTQLLIWPDFHATWPLLANPNPAAYIGAKQAAGAWGIPVINTLILLLSSITLLWANWSIKQNKRWLASLGLSLTLVAGIVFTLLQIHQLHTMITVDGITLKSGIYGSFVISMLGLHVLHVVVGLILLFIILLRCLGGHFNAKNHFAIEATVWYWNFVDVIWLLMFIAIYWL